MKDDDRRFSDTLVLRCPPRLPAMVDRAAAQRMTSPSVTEMADIQAELDCSATEALRIQKERSSERLTQHELLLAFDGLIPGCGTTFH